MNEPGKPSSPLIPPPPPTVMRRRANDGRGLVWFFMLLLGIGVGTAFYQWVPDVSFTFDYWVALALR